MAEPIPKMGHHLATCCPFCDAELLVDICFNVECFLFGYVAPLPVRRIVRDVPRRRWRNWS